MQEKRHPHWKGKTVFTENIMVYIENLMVSTKAKLLKIVREFKKFAG